jgi:hypothetical protein
LSELRDGLAGRHRTPPAAVATWRSGPELALR